MPAPQYISIKALSERWDIGHQTIRRMISDGELPFVKRFGRSWRFLLSDIEAYENKQQAI